MGWPAMHAFLYVSARCQHLLLLFFPSVLPSQNPFLGFAVISMHGACMRLLLLLLRYQPIG